MAFAMLEKMKKKTYPMTVRDAYCFTHRTKSTISEVNSTWLFTRVELLLVGASFSLRYKVFAAPDVVCLFVIAIVPFISRIKVKYVHDEEKYFSTRVTVILHGTEILITPNCYACHLISFDTFRKPIQVQRFLPGRPELEFALRAKRQVHLIFRL